MTSAPLQSSSSSLEPDPMPPAGVPMWFVQAFDNQEYYDPRETLINKVYNSGIKNSYDEYSRKQSFLRSLRLIT